MLSIVVIAVLICILIAGLSLAASLLTVGLIKILGKWNGYLLLVLSLTICQAIYDIGFFTLPWYTTPSGRVLYSLFSAFGGISSTLWSNVIMLVTCKIVVNLKSVNIMDQVCKHVLLTYIVHHIFIILTICATYLMYIVYFIYSISSILRQL